MKSVSRNQPEVGSRFWCMLLHLDVNFNVWRPPVNAWHLTNWVIPQVTFSLRMWNAGRSWEWKWTKIISSSILSHWCHLELLDTIISASQHHLSSLPLLVIFRGEPNLRFQENNHAFTLVGEDLFECMKDRACFCFHVHVQRHSHSHVWVDMDYLFWNPLHRRPLLHYGRFIRIRMVMST